MYIVKDCNTRATIFEGSYSECERFIIECGFRIVADGGFDLWVA
jgi:hypothetical protein